MRQNPNIIEQGIINMHSYTRRKTNECVFSIIVPVLNEAEQINSLIENIRNQGSGHCYEIIVVDGDPQGNTIEVIQDKNVIVITTEKNRARQMNTGAAAAGGETLIFLHADTKLPDNALEKISRVLKNQKYVGGAFNLGIDSDRLFLKYIAVRANMRSRSNRIPYGDQAVFIRKNYFDKIGGFKEIPLMEDIDLMRRIKKDGKKIYILPDKVMTSPRRWERDGMFYTTMRNHVLVALFYLGVSPTRLAKHYWKNSDGAKTNTSPADSQYANIKKYYSQVIQKTSDLKTNACCTSKEIPDRIDEVMLLINDEVKDKYYGCGSPIPLCLENLKILDLGCGTGRDCYVMSKLVGQNGFVYGIDMTENQIAIARKHSNTQTKAFGYGKPNVKFIFDYIEDVPKHFEKESLDVITSNCVINLTENKDAVFNNAYQILKFGGEIYFSDVYADRRIPSELSKDPVLRGECLGGALYFRDFEKIARKVGFSDPRIVSKRDIEINNKKIEALIGNIRFCSITYRLWKLKGLEDHCEDYGHIAVYNGRIPQSPLKFRLDEAHVFHKNKPEKVCGNTALMLSETRFKKYFQVLGSFKEHFGAFKNCSTLEQNNATDSSCSSCC